MEKPVDKALIRKFIDNSCTPEEIARIRKFMEQPGADQFFEEILNERWTEGDEPYDEAQMREWEKKFGRKIAQISPAPPGRFRLPSYFRYAAAALVIAAAGFGWFLLGKNGKPPVVALLESSTTAGKLLKIQLPDSTIVYLNAESRLQYPEKFTGATRTVILHGEAFFDVRPDGQHPFMVTADKLSIQVLGTSFNVRSYQDDEDIAVTVATGKVGVTVPGTKSSAANILLPDNELTYSKHSGKLEVTAVNAADSKAWERGSFVFNYETLENITRRLSRWYGVDFVCTSDALLQKRFKLRLKNEDLKNVMEALSASAGFEYQIKEKQVIIK